MILDDLTEKFLKFPGIGPRQAKRFAYFLARSDGSFMRELADLLLSVKNKVIQCHSCYRLFESASRAAAEECSICSSPSRDKTTLMIVEKEADLETVEQAGAYQGNYFILGNVKQLSSNSKAKTAEPRFRELLTRVTRGESKIKEIILAMSATTEGDFTANYILERVLPPFIKKYPETKITRLGRGLSTGAELEYSDKDTIAAALGGRR